jgi:hypothetical protein
MTSEERQRFSAEYRRMSSLPSVPSTDEIRNALRMPEPHVERMRMLLSTHREKWNGGPISETELLGTWLFHSSASVWRAKLGLGRVSRITFMQMLPEHRRVFGALPVPGRWSDAFPFPMALSDASSRSTAWMAVKRLELAGFVVKEENSAVVEGHGRRWKEPARYRVRLPLDSEREPLELRVRRIKEALGGCKSYTVADLERAERGLMSNGSS